MISKALLAADDDRRAHDEPGVPRGLARGPARRRLHRLLRGRDGLRDLADDRRARRRGRRTSSPTARCRWSSSTSPATPTEPSLGVPLREAPIPPDSRVAAIIRGDQRRDPARRRGRSSPGDRIVVIGSPQAAQALGRADRARHRQGRATSSSSAPAGPAPPIARAAARAGHRRPADRGRRASAPATSPPSCPTRASTTPPASTPTSSSASGSPTRRSRSSRCATT